MRRGQGCHWLRRRRESRPPSRDVRVGSRRVLQGHNSFLQTGNTVKHKTQTKKRRERESRGRKAGGGRAERQGGTDRCNYRHLPATSCPHQSHPIPSFSPAPSRCKSNEVLKNKAWAVLLGFASSALLLEKAAAELSSIEGYVRGIKTLRPSRRPISCPPLPRFRASLHPHHAEAWVAWPRSIPQGWVQAEPAAPPAPGVTPCPAPHESQAVLVDCTLQPKESSARREASATIES